MLSNEVLEKLFNREDVRKVPLEYQATIVHAVEEVLEEVKNSDELLQSVSEQYV